jgi:hypothetical protein
MDAVEPLRKKLEQIRRSLEAGFCRSPHDPLLNDVRERVNIVEGMLVGQGPFCNDMGSDSHPLGKNPLATVHVQFHLNRCQDLLLRFESSSVSLSEKPLKTTRLLYPTIAETLRMRVFAVLIYWRARIVKYPACYDTPMLRELLYLKSPFWLSPILKIVLPKRRRQWHHTVQTPQK